MVRRTNITIPDEELWKWARKRAIDLGFRGVSRYLFALVEKDRRGEIRWESGKESGVT